MINSTTKIRYFKIIDEFIFGNNIRCSLNFISGEFIIQTSGKIGSDYLQISDSEYFDKSYVPTNF